MLRPDTKAMGHVLDVVWYGLNIRKANGVCYIPTWYHTVGRGEGKRYNAAD